MESHIYYVVPAVEVRYGTERLDRLIGDFCFKSVADGTNYLGMLPTTLLVPRFIGSKPAVPFNGNQPERGKSILARIIAILHDFHVVETATCNPNDAEFEKRLGTIVRRGTMTILIDNAKAWGRSPWIESACLERSITDAILSFRLLGFSIVVLTLPVSVFVEIKQTGTIVLGLSRQNDSPSPESVENLETRASSLRICIQRDSSDVIDWIAQNQFGVMEPTRADRHRCGKTSQRRNSNPLHPAILFFQVVNSR